MDRETADEISRRFTAFGEGLRTEFQGLPELRTEFQGLRTEMQTGQELGRAAGDSGSRTEMQTEILGLRTEMQTEILGLRTEMQTEMQGQRTEMQTEMRTVRRHFDVVGEGLRGQVRLVAEGVHGLREDDPRRIHRRSRGISETQTMIRLSFADLDRRIRS